MASPKVLVMSGYGINCEEETAFAFEKAGARATIVHVNDLIDGIESLHDYQILAFPGGFSYGDDTGSGNAFANKVRSRAGDQVKSFVESGNLAIGICNGCQIMANLGLVPAIDSRYGERTVGLEHNTSARYHTRWVDLVVTGKGPWLECIETISLPIAHGEGRFHVDPETLTALKDRKMIAVKYFAGPVCIDQSLPGNPNGSLEDIAGITDESGRVLALMPHPERAIDFTHLPNWTALREEYKRAGRQLPEEGHGLQLFKNAVRYFK